MPEPIIHFVIPFTAVMVLKRDYKLGILAGLFGLLPDFDVIIKIHRSMTHSLVLQLIFVVAIAGILYFFKIRNLSFVFFVLLFSLFSHSILDLFYDYTPILYPFIQDDILVYLYLDIYLTRDLLPKISFIFKINTRVTDFTPFTDFNASLVTGPGLIISIILLLIVIFRDVKGLMHRVISRYFNP